MVHQATAIGVNVGCRRRAHVVEVVGGRTWVKSSASSSGGGDSCLEMTVAAGRVLVRCARHRQDVLDYSSDAWKALLRHVGDA
jgi:hypothetical protein